MRLRLFIFAFILTFAPFISVRANPPSVRLEQLTSEIVQSVDWSPDGQYLLYSTILDSESRQLDVMRISDKSIVWEKAGNYYPAHWSPDGTMIATGGDALIVFDWQTKQALFSLSRNSDSFTHNPDFIANLDWESTGDSVAVITSEGEVVIVSVPQGEVIQRNANHFGGLIAHLLDWSSDNRYLATQGYDIYQGVSIWAVDKNKDGEPEIPSDHPIIDRIPGDPPHVDDIEWNPTSTEIAQAYEGLQIFSTNDQRYTVIHQDQWELTSAVAWSPDGKILVDSTSEDGESFYLNFWDTSDFALIRKDESTLHHGMISQMAWSPDSAQLALATWGGLWVYHMPPTNH